MQNKEETIKSSKHLLTIYHEKMQQDYRHIVFQMASSWRKNGNDSCKNSFEKHFKLKKKIQKNFKKENFIKDNKHRRKKIS